MEASVDMLTQRSRLAVVLAILTVMLAAMLPGSPARAAEPVYTITNVTRAWFYDAPPDITKCDSKYSNPLNLNLSATVTNPIWDGQVYVEGLRVAIYSGDTLLGTVRTMEAFLDPGHRSSTFVHISCRAWGGLLAKGFGGPDTSYQVKLLGPGQAFDTNDGSPAGTVEAPDTAFPVTLGQFAKTTKLHGAKAGDDVKISTSLRVWAKANGTYSWRAAKRARVILYKTRANKWVRVDSVLTSRTGDFTVRFAANRNNYVKFKFVGLTSDHSPYWVKRNGDIEVAFR